MHMAATRIEKHGVVGAIVSDPEGHMIELIETMSDE